MKSMNKEYILCTLCFVFYVAKTRTKTELRSKTSLYFVIQKPLRRIYVK